MILPFIKSEKEKDFCPICNGKLISNFDTEYQEHKIIGSKSTRLIRSVGCSNCLYNQMMQYEGLNHENVTLYRETWFPEGEDKKFVIIINNNSNVLCALYKTSYVNDIYNKVDLQISPQEKDCLIKGYHKWRNMKAFM